MADHAPDQAAGFGFYLQRPRFSSRPFRVEFVTEVMGQVYEGRTESHEQQFFACELGTADEGEYCRRWNQLLCYP